MAEMTPEQKAAREFMRKRNEQTRKQQQSRDISGMFKPGSGAKSASDVPKVTQGKTSKSEEGKLKGRKGTENVIKRRKRMLDEI